EIVEPPASSSGRPGSGRASVLARGGRAVDAGERASGHVPRGRGVAGPGVRRRALRTVRLTGVAARQDERTAAVRAHGPTPPPDRGGRAAARPGLPRPGD